MTLHNYASSNWIVSNTLNEVGYLLMSVVLWVVFALLAFLLLLINNLTFHDISTNKSVDATTSIKENFCSIFYCKINLKYKMITRVTLIFLFVCVLISVFASIILNSISTSKDANNVFVANQTIIQDDNEIVLDNRFENLFWFMQISDTHLSFYQNKDRETDLLSFCQHTVPIIKPPVLLLTGDITDSRNKDPMSSDQHVTEWNIYRKIYKECIKFNPNLTWLDIIGNHDNFNVYGSYNNFNKNYTVQGTFSNGTRSYRHAVESGGKKYSFIGADACLKPGVRRPFNFIGKFDKEEIKRITELKQESADSDYVVWFGHYPTSSIANNNQFRSLINGPYLCGHFHTFHGKAMQMISTQPQGYLEAEVGDWKDYRTFRILAIDGGLFTFADFYYNKHKDKPLIVITNPRSVLHQMEHIEPFWRTARSTHIRALVFSHKPLAHVKAYISTDPKPNENEELESFEMTHVKGPLWVAKWDPSLYKKGLYYVKVVAMDEQGINEVSVPFSLDNTKPLFPTLSRIIIRINFKTIGIFLFSIAFFLSTIPLLVIRFYTSTDNEYYRHMLNLSRRSYCRKLIFKLYLLTHIDKMFYPIILIPFYLLIGPWCLGHFVMDYIGVAFIWGQFVDGYYLPVGFTFVFAFLFLIVFHIPFVMCLSSLIYSCYKKVSFQTGLSTDTTEINLDHNQCENQHSTHFCDFFSLNLFFALSIAILAGAVSTMFYFAYGYLSIFFNVFAWISLIYFVLIGTILRLTPIHSKNIDRKFYYSVQNAIVKS